jgi:2-polyprenyl-6-methoxyphenol hydroxylase-like FAD-dependent oxidoreductase
MDRAPLLVIGAGPYGLSTAALARERGIDTTVLGHPMAFCNEHMPAGMFLRSGSDWHLDASGVHTLEARGIDATDVDPIPLSLFVDYADWFRHKKGVEVHMRCLRALKALAGPDPEDVPLAVHGHPITRWNGRLMTCLSRTFTTIRR